MNIPIIMAFSFCGTWLLLDGFYYNKPLKAYAGAAFIAIALSVVLFW